jgi:soluble lytic murein transglycosylase-like protein
MALPKYSVRDLIDMIRRIAPTYKVDADLAVAIAGVETNYHAYKTRFEAKWSYFLKPETYAQQLGISLDTEKKDQATSWGPMQIMGSVCRELGYVDHLVGLVDPELAISYSCKKLNILQKKYTNESDAISAYNAGTPRKNTQGIYLNQIYLDHVRERLNKLRLF